MVEQALNCLLIFICTHTSMRTHMRTKAKHHLLLLLLLDHRSNTCSRHNHALGPWSTKQIVGRRAPIVDTQQNFLAAAFSCMCKSAFSASSPAILSSSPRMLSFLVDSSPRGQIAAPSPRGQICQWSLRHCQQIGIVTALRRTLLVRSLRLGTYIQAAELRSDLLLCTQSMAWIL